MVNYLGFALMLVVVAGTMFMLAVFQAAAVEVRRKPRLAIATMDPLSEANKDQQLAA